MEITAEMIRQNYPQVYWQIYKQARTETLNDENAQREMAQRHLERTLAKPAAANPAQASPASAAPRPSAVTVDPAQAEVNRQLGLSNETFAKYNHAAPSQVDPAQAKVNAQLGLSDETFTKFANR